jgi:hypothetical protein
LKLRSSKKVAQQPDCSCSALPTPGRRTTATSGSSAVERVELHAPSERAATASVAATIFFMGTLDKKTNRPRLRRTTCPLEAIATP